MMSASLAHVPLVAELVCQDTQTHLGVGMKGVWGQRRRLGSVVQGYVVHRVLLDRLPVIAVVALFAVWLVTQNPQRLLKGINYG